MAVAIVAGRVLPENKHIWVALTSIYGIGRSRAIKICQEANLVQTSKVKELTENELELIREVMAKFTIEGDLRREVASAKKNLQVIGSYRGIRSRRGLPCRGQRTKTNAKTQKRLRRRA